MYQLFVWTLHNCMCSTCILLWLNMAGLGSLSSCLCMVYLDGHRCNPCDKSYNLKLFLCVCSLSLSLSIYIYIYIYNSELRRRCACICVCVCVCVCLKNKLYLVLLLFRLLCIFLCSFYSYMIVRWHSIFKFPDLMWSHRSYFISYKYIKLWLYTS